MSGSELINLIYLIAELIIRLRELIAKHTEPHIFVDDEPSFLPRCSVHFLRHCFQKN